MPVKNKIKEFVDKRGISVYKFRKDTGIAQRTAYDLYSNPWQLPNSSVITKICDCYEIQPNEIIEWVPLSQRSNDHQSVA
ncbi:hypothetical protein NIES4071_50580 [Calothrix sp. NIES-4071]|nr:hypothetical protein NIES4071_50580 [Calothrix sp. NIES-4071]BAZ59365.1 hypothetical protein NIES4105_50520 [Calothrix sp. NIES-4105]